jgi:PEP-CTERM motif
MKKSTFPTLLLLFLSLLLASAAGAMTMTPYYSFSEYYGQGGYVIAGPNVTPSGHLVSEHDSQEAAGTTSVAGGQAWWATGGGGVSIGAISSQGWGEVTSNPEAGTIGSRSGANHTDTGGTPVSYPVSLGGATFTYTPWTWGNGESYGYIRMLYEVGTDGSLATGANVDLLAGLHVSGEFDGENDLYMRTTMMVNQVGNAFWLDAREYTDYGTLEDIVLPDPVAMNNMLWFQDVSRNSDDTDDPININASASMQVNVGDIILVEAMLKTDAVLPNDGNGRDIWAEFGNTLASNLTTDTAGAVLTPYSVNGGSTPVPEPAILGLLGIGLVGLAGLRRKIF